MRPVYLIPLAFLPFLFLRKDSMTPEQDPELPDLDFPPEDEPTKPDSIRQCVVATAQDEIGAGKWDKYTDGVTAVHPGTRVSWCGIFALWVLHQCGLGTNFQWNYGKGFLYRLPRTTQPRPGDIAYIDQPFQHHAIVKEVEGDIVRTIDGNQAGDLVTMRTRKLKDITAFYSIQPLIEGTIVA